MRKVLYGTVWFNDGHSRFCNLVHTGTYVALLSLTHTNTHLRVSTCSSCCCCSFNPKRVQLKPFLSLTNLVLYSAENIFQTARHRTRFLPGREPTDQVCQEDRLAAPTVRSALRLPAALAADLMYVCSTGSLSTVCTQISEMNCPIHRVPPPYTHPQPEILSCVKALLCVCACVY